MNEQIKDGNRRAAREQAVEWYFRRDGGSLSPVEEAEFRAWLADPQNQTAYDDINATWNKLGRIPRPASDLPEPRRTRPLWPAVKRQALSAIAATIAVLGIGYVLDLPTRLQADALTAVGETRTVALADGSTAVLNTGSALAIDYSPGERRIRLLRGEAIFDVAKDASRPFVVSAAGGEARALGTAFAVRADGGSKASVTVIESRVEVSYPANATPVELDPNETVSYSGAGIGRVEPINADSETAWRRGKLVFVDRPLGSVISELNRYHSGRIQIADASIGNHPISGVFDLSDPLKIVDALEASLGLHSTRLTSYLILLHR